MTTNPEKSGQSRLNLENPSLDQNQDQDYLDDIDGMLLASTDDTNCDSSPSDTGTDTGRVFHVAGVGPVNQSVDSNNVVTTSFPEGSKLQTIKYDPANKEDPYTVKFRDGNHDAELEKVVKEGRFCLPVLLEPQSEDPDSIDFFDPYFNQVGELEDKQGSHRLYPDGRLVKGDNIESSEIDKDRDTDKPFFTGIEKPFEYGAEKGCLYTDEQAGYVQGINFSEGKRKGQQYRFDRDEKGNVTSIEAKIPGEGGDTRQISIRKSGDNWQIEPADARIPRFETLKVDAKGVLTGDFKVKDNGDIVYDAKDGTKEAVRIDGSRDQYNLNEYSRIRESAEGAKSTEYWDGYNWRQGQAQMGTDGTTTINFPPEAGKPAQVIRDARVDENGITSNKFKVVFAGGKSYDADWGKQKMTYASQQGSVDLYNSGVTSDDGKSVWMQGRQVGTANDAAVVELKPGTEHQSKRMAAGQTPYRVAIHNNGEVTSVFKDGPQIRSDGRGNVSQIVHTNGQEIDVIRDANQNVVELKGSDGRQIVREKVLQSGADGSSQSRYQITDNGKSVGSIDGAINFGPAGRLDIEGSNNDKVSIEPTGRIVTQRQGQIIAVTDANRQSWAMEQSQGDGKKPKWTVNSNGKSHTFEGELKLYDNGLVAVQTGADTFETRNPDASHSTFNLQGIEVKRTFDDGAHIQRDAQGFVTETRNNAGDVKTFVRKPGTDGTQVVDQVLLNGKPFEVLKNGKLKALAPGSPDQTVEYDPISGNRTVRSSDDAANKARRVEGLHGDFEEYNEKGERQRARIADLPASIAREYEGEKLTAVENTSTGIKRHYDYTGSTGEYPTKIAESKEGNQPQVIANMARMDGVQLPFYILESNGEMVGISLSTGEFEKKEDSPQVKRDFGEQANASTNSRWISALAIVKGENLDLRVKALPDDMEPFPFSLA